MSDKKQAKKEYISIAKEIMKQPEIASHFGNSRQLKIQEEEKCGFFKNHASRMRDYLSKSYPNHSFSVSDAWNGCTVAAYDNRTAKKYPHYSAAQ